MKMNLSEAGMFEEDQLKDLSHKFRLSGIANNHENDILRSVYSASITAVVRYSSMEKFLSSPLPPSGLGSPWLFRFYLLWLAFSLFLHSLHAFKLFSYCFCRLVLRNFHFASWNDIKTHWKSSSRWNEMMIISLVCFHLFSPFGIILQYQVDHFHVSDVFIRIYGLWDGISIDVIVSIEKKLFSSDRPSCRSILLFL